MKKIYQKPEMRAIEINAEQTILTMSGPQGKGLLGDGDNPDDFD